VGRDPLTRNTRWLRSDPRIGLLRGARERAKRLGLPCTLTREDIYVPNYCPVLGIPLANNWGGGRQADSSPTIDRIDNTRGYVLGNIIVISWKANRIKSNATPDELRAVAKFYSPKHKDT
jgi:hypothetical protein